MIDEPGQASHGLKPISYAELVKRTGIALLPSVTTESRIGVPTVQQRALATQIDQTASSVKDLGRKSQVMVAADVQATSLEASIKRSRDTPAIQLLSVQSNLPFDQKALRP